MKKTFNITTKKAWRIVSSLDSSKFLNLDEADTSRLDLVFFAIALGYKRGYPSDTKEARHSITRTEYFNNHKYLMSAIYFDEYIASGDKSIDSIVDNDAILELAQNYAETGFEVIQEKIEEGHGSDENFCLELLSELNDMYESYFE